MKYVRMESGAWCNLGRACAIYVEKWSEHWVVCVDFCSEEESNHVWIWKGGFENEERAQEWLDEQFINPV